MENSLFMSLLVDEAAFEEMSRPRVRCIVRTCIRNPNDDEENDPWLQWRLDNKRHGILSASSLPDLCGVGYNSITAALKKLKSLEKPEPLGWFVKDAMKHGIQYEEEAMRRVLTLLVTKGYELHDHMDPTLQRAPTSEVFEIRRKKSEKLMGLLCCTMDCILQKKGSEDGEFIPLEIKCPVYWKTKGMSIMEGRDRERAQHPYGRANHFIQAACYAFTHRAKEFMVYLHFTDGAISTGICLHYRFTREMKLFLYALIDTATTELVKEKPNNRAFRSAKQAICNLVATCLLDVSIIDVHFESYSDVI